MHRWGAGTPSLCIPPTQHLSAGEEAGVYQRYAQLCCPSVSAAQGGPGTEAAKTRQSITCPPPAPPPGPSAPRGWAEGIREGGGVARRRGRDCIHQPPPHREEQDLTTGWSDWLGVGAREGGKGEGAAQALTRLLQNSSLRALPRVLF